MRNFVENGADVNDLTKIRFVHSSSSIFLYVPKYCIINNHRTLLYRIYNVV